ncbi:MAG: hypothetical protein LBL84_01510 [Candidatus Nomurabacteria bacterium]|jgi:hypothetical protein|nr:hypothetical protein [Candidatus Nomurabacteria bacterium]
MGFSVRYVDARLIAEYVLANKTNSTLELTTSLDFSKHEIFYVAALEGKWLGDGAFLSQVAIVKRAFIDRDMKDNCGSLSLVGYYIPHKGYNESSPVRFHHTLVKYGWSDRGPKR